MSIIRKDSDHSESFNRPAENHASRFVLGFKKQIKRGVISHDLDLWIRKEVQSCRAFWVQTGDFNRHFWFHILQMRCLTAVTVFCQREQWQTSRGEVHRRSSLHQHDGTSIHSVGLDLRNVQKWDDASRFSLFPVLLTSDAAKGGWCGGLICKCGDVKLKGNWCYSQTGSKRMVDAMTAVNGWEAGIPTGLGCSRVHHRKHVWIIQMLLESPTCLMFTKL